MRNRLAQVRSTTTVRAIGLLAATVTVGWELLGLHGVVRNPELDVVLALLAGLALGLVGYLLMGRARRSRRLLEFRMAFAIFVLSAGSLLYEAIPDFVTPHHPPTFASWSAMSCHLLAAVLFASLSFGANAKLTRGSAQVVVLLSVITVVFPGLFFLALELPHPPRVGVLTVVAHLISASVFTYRAIRCARVADENSDPFLHWLAIGIALGAIGGVNYALHPSLYLANVGMGDSFRLFGLIALLVCGACEIKSYWVRLAVAERSAAEADHDAEVIVMQSYRTAA